MYLVRILTHFTEALIYSIWITPRMVIKKHAIKEAQCARQHCFWIKRPKYLQEIRLFSCGWRLNLLSHGGLKRECFQVLTGLVPAFPPPPPEWSNYWGGFSFPLTATKGKRGYMDELWITPWNRLSTPAWMPRTCEVSLLIKWYLSRWALNHLRTVHWNSVL